MKPCVLCGATGKHEFECPNPDGDPQKKASFDYFCYLSRSENPDDESPRWVLFIKWIIYLIDPVS